MKWRTADGRTVDLTKTDHQHISNIFHFNRIMNNPYKIRVRIMDIILEHFGGKVLDYKPYFDWEPKLLQDRGLFVQNFTAGSLVKEDNLIKFIKEEKKKNYLDNKKRIKYIEKRYLNNLLTCFRPGGQYLVLKITDVSLYHCDEQCVVLNLKMDSHKDTLICDKNQIKIHEQRITHEITTYFGDDLKIVFEYLEEMYFM